MQLGTPITIISGGIIALMAVSLKPNRTISPTLNTTPQQTTSKEKITG